MADGLERIYDEGVLAGTVHGYSRAIADLRAEADRIEAEQPVTALDLRRAAALLETKAATGQTT